MKKRNVVCGCCAFVVPSKFQRQMRDMDMPNCSTERGRGSGEPTEEGRGTVMQPRQVQWPPNCAGKCHTRGSRTCQSTPVADVAARDGGEVSVSRELRGRAGEGSAAGPLRPLHAVVHFVCNSFSFRFCCFFIPFSLFFFGFRKVVLFAISSTSSFYELCNFCSTATPHPLLLHTSLLIFIFCVFVTLLNGCGRGLGELGGPLVSGNFSGYNSCSW